MDGHNSHLALFLNSGHHALAQRDEESHPRTGNPVVAFIIGLAIILLASILNAAGLNLTKLDHVCRLLGLKKGILKYLLQVRTSAIPKASRQKDWLRPLWLLGMLLYMFVQVLFHASFCSN